MVDLEAPERGDFDNTHPSVASLVGDIKAKARQCVDAGARGLCQLLR
jgi:hypothetical protein